MTNEVEKYNNEFEELEAIILNSKQKVWQKVNYEYIYLNWAVGCYVAAKLENAQWGEKVVSNFSLFLKQRNPQLKGFDKRSIYRMVQFFNTYFNTEFAVAMQPQLPENENKQVVAALQPQLHQTEIQEFNNPILKLLAASRVRTL